MATWAGPYGRILTDEAMHYRAEWLAKFRDDLESAFSDAESRSRSSSRCISDSLKVGFMTRLWACHIKTSGLSLPKYSRSISYMTPCFEYGLEMAISFEPGIVAIAGRSAANISVSGETPCESQNATSSQITAARVKPRTLRKSEVLTMITVPLSNSISSARSLTNHGGHWRYLTDDPSDIGKADPALIFVTRQNQDHRPLARI